MSSTESASAHRAPAWKRLGLTLKHSGGSPAAAGASTAPTAGSPVVGQPGGSTGHKRRVEAPPGTGEGTPLKKTKREESRPALSPATTKRAPSALSTPQNGSSASTKPKKSVKFGETPTKNDITDNSKPAKQTPRTKKPKSKGEPAKRQTPPSTADLTPALEYLRQWKTSRESWKFSKNLQSTLIKHIFEPSIIPAREAEIFYEYIRDLKGFVRNRLRETAMEIQMEDASAGTAGFHSDAMDLDEKQEAYDAILADVLRRRRENAAKRKFFNEAQYLAESQDGEVVIRRVVKRMRAEMVMEELSDGEMTDATAASSASSRTVAASDTNATTNTDQVKKPADGVSEGVSGKRRRKLRVNMEDSSSSESSDSDSDTSSDSSTSSSDESDSDDEAVDEGPDEADDTSSSSSSSSESESSDEDSDDDDDDAE